MMIRLDKFLTEMGCGTRSQVKKMITKGIIKVNGLTEKKPERKINTEEDDVLVDGELISYVKYEYYMLNKPAGVISATEDPKDRTVLDLITDHKRKDLFPVGRLDKDTEGLLLITNNGKLAHDLLSPKKHVDKVYYAKVTGSVGDEDIHKFAEGLDIGDEKLTMPAVLKVLHTNEEQDQPVSEVFITIKEGRYHQVKRMFEAVDKKVIYLKRMKFGSLSLDESLKPGEYRKLTDREVKELC